MSDQLCSFSNPAVGTKRDPTSKLQKHSTFGQKACSLDKALVEEFLRFVRFLGAAFLFVFFP